MQRANGSHNALNEPARRSARCRRFTAPFVAAGLQPPKITLFMMRPGSQGEQPGDDQGQGEDPDHRSSVGANIMLPRPQYGQRDNRQREQRQEMDWAPDPPYPYRMDEKRRACDQNHQRRPRPPEFAMRPRPLRRQELDRAETDRRKGEGRMKLNDRRGGEERSERHDRTPEIRPRYRLLAPAGAPLSS